MQRSFIVFLCVFICGVLGDVSISRPRPGASFSASGGEVTIDLSWMDDASDGDYLLSNVDWYSFVLCTGPDTSIEAVYTIDTMQTLNSNSYTAKFPSSVTGNGYYFIQIYAMFEDGDATMHYTDRFRLTGMTGSTATLSVGPTETGSGPAANTQYANADGTSIDSSSFYVTYTRQTGKTRFAPMQTQPGTRISHTTWSRRHATSTYTPYSSITGSPNVDSTVTAGWNYTVTSDHNWASVQDSPTSWYEPSERVTQASLSTASKKRRWID